MTMTRKDQATLKGHIFASVVDEWPVGRQIGAFEVTRIVTHESFVQIWMRHIEEKKGPSTCFTVRISGE